MSLRLTELGKQSCVTGSPGPRGSRVKITVGWRWQLLRTELGRPCLLACFAQQGVILSLPTRPVANAAAAAAAVSQLSTARPCVWSWAQCDFEVALWPLHCSCPTCAGTEQLRGPHPARRAQHGPGALGLGRLQKPRRAVDGD